MHLTHALDLAPLSQSKPSLTTLSELASTPEQDAAQKHHALERGRRSISLCGSAREFATLGKAGVVFSPNGSGRKPLWYRGHLAARSAAHGRRGAGAATAATTRSGARLRQGPTDAIEPGARELGNTDG